MAQLPRPAADVAAMEDEAAAWADVLDVKDSDIRIDLPSSRLLRPSTNATPHPSKSPPRSSHHQRIPGPASAVQEAMRLRSTAASPVLGCAANAQTADADFLLHPWLCALQFLGNDRTWEQPGIRGIKGDQELLRAPLVVGVVTSCKPNGLGDLILTLKTQSRLQFTRKFFQREILARIYQLGVSFFSVRNYQFQVAVFRPSRTACYLNVTKGKVVKVLRKDCDAPSRQVISSSTTESQLPAKCTETGRVAHLGDNHMERRAEIETSEGTASIFSKMISRTKDSHVAKVHCESSEAANVARSSTLSLDRGIIHCVANKTNLNPPIKNVPSYNSSQLSLKTFNSINPDNCQQRQGGSSPMYERSEAEGSTNNVMMRLLGRERMMSSSKEMTVAKVSSDHHGTPDSTNSSSTLDTYARCSSGNSQEIGLQILTEGSRSWRTSNSSTDGHPQQNLNIPNTTCLQSSIGGSSVLSGDRYCTQASANENLRRPFDNEQMLHSSKKLKSGAILSDGNGAAANSSMDTENKHGIESIMNIELELDNIAEKFSGEHALMRKPNEHQRRDLNAANEGNVEPTKEYATTIGGSFLPNPKKTVSVASVAGWTDEQLAELFADY
ncbi:uncharacterized protein LOC133891340 isoform X2 [Phragmites australis]|uniref:uncharacterized protein LOC133891340 isoform X2 n=1 Tax=Phragmites australis TaxID=29695 RepID=UPI002D77AD62|nr:uncharacterized protein LOC133891340 isoform X2 [Phragmites australis]